MADFRTAVLKTLEHEGGFQNSASDHANWSSGKIGEGTLIGTKYGITAVDMPGVDIENLTVDQAVSYYSEHYWKTLYSQINSQAVANKLFDLGVLFGCATAVGILQLTLGTKVDHSFGPMTLAAVNQADENSLLTSYKANFVTHAFNVATANPAERGDLKGWSVRINS
jgi:lysozyme family protein